MTIEQLLNELRPFNKDSLIVQINNVQQYDDKIVVLIRINKTAINVRKLVQLLLNYPDDYKVLIKLDLCPESVSGVFSMDNQVLIHSIAPPRFGERIVIYI